MLEQEVVCMMDWFELMDFFVPGVLELEEVLERELCVLELVAVLVLVVVVVLSWVELVAATFRSYWVELVAATFRSYNGFATAVWKSENVVLLNFKFVCCVWVGFGFFTPPSSSISTFPGFIAVFLFLFWLSVLHALPFLCIWMLHSNLLVDIGLNVKSQRPHFNLSSAYTSDGSARAMALNSSVVVVPLAFLGGFGSPNAS